MTTVLCITLIYLAAVISIGIYSFFKVEKTSDYYISGKRGSWLQISGSLFATIMGGSAILGTIEMSQQTGWPAIWFLLSAAIGLFVLAFLSKRINLLGHYTLPELLLLFYGKKAETLAGILIPIAWTGIVAAQIIAGAKILTSLQLVSYHQGALICGLTFIFYTVAGGQLSILKTDFMQALIILGGISLLFFLRLKNGTPVQMDNFTFFNEKFTPPDLFFLLLTYSVTFVVGPDIYTRIFCARNEKVARNSVLTVAFLAALTAFILTWLGIASRSDANVASGFILPGASFLPPWALGILVAALLSAVMSSADTTLLTSSTILSELVTGDLDKPKSLKITRRFIVVIGMASLVIAMKITSILNTLLISLSFFSGAFIFPIIAGLAHWKVNKDNALAAIILGGILALVGKIVNEATSGNHGYWLIAAAFIVNAILLLYRRKKKIS
ncbi:MAG: sodium:solute symporter family protein [Prolixibacteraceae bacterium]|nr:sodium:solute symporter family protein [Prolixibacteraceae bacterium]